MARKKKDIEEENINADSQGDINEADDSFGLPDLDFKPVDELDDVVEEATETISEEVEEAGESFEAFTSDVEESTSLNTDTESDFTVSESEESFTLESSNSYDTDTIEEETDDEAGFVLTEDTDTDLDEEEYVPGSYTPPHSSSNVGGKIVLIVLLLALLGGLGWYFLSYKPKHDAEVAKAETEQKAKEEEQQRIAAQDKAAKEKEEAERLAQEQQAQEEAEQQAADSAPGNIGTIETISSRTGRYYAIVGSALDGDLAMDYAKKTVKDGTSIKIIPPFGGGKFHRIAVADLDTWAEAQNKADELKATYGDDVWVLKY